MKRLLFVTIPTLLAIAPGLAAEPASKVKVPQIGGDYINVYQPEAKVFPGPNAANLVADQFYEEWVPNDHCFARDDAGRWHAFGITHPLTDFDLQTEVAVLDAHAPEIFQDETGDWFISSVEWPHRGVSIAPLIWK